MKERLEIIATINKPRSHCVDGSFQEATYMMTINAMNFHDDGEASPACWHSPGLLSS